MRILFRHDLLELTNSESKRLEFEKDWIHTITGLFQPHHEIYDSESGSLTIIHGKDAVTKIQALGFSTKQISFIFETLDDFAKKQGKVLK